MIQKLSFYFQYPFVRYALIVGVLIALCSSLLGVTLVLKRFSFIGDGLSHVAFGAMAIAAVLNFTNKMIFILPVTILCAVLLLKTGQNTKIKGDLYNLLIAIITAVIIVLAMNLVGSLLISALVIFPALSAMRVYKTFMSVTICSVVLSVLCALMGILVSILAGTPVGSTIVAIDIAAFIVSCIIGKVVGGKA